MVKDLSTADKHSIVQFCLVNYDPVKNRLRDGSVKAISQEFQVAEITVKKLWAKWRAAHEEGATVVDLENKKRGRVGRRSKLTPAVRANYILIGQEYADLHIRLNARLLKEALGQRGT